MSCIKKIALREPLVDTVEPSAQTTTACKFFSIDLNTVKTEDLSWQKPFTCKGIRKDFMHAFIAWFDVEFSRCHKPVTISTAPASTYTHWKQTVFYLEDLLSISEGDVISGHVSCKPNAKNPRDLDIDIHVDFDGKWGQIHKTQEYLLR